MKSLDFFKFKFAAGYDKPAIWLTLHEREVAIYPFALYELFWDCYKRRRISQGVEARFQILKEEVDGYYHDDAYGSYHIEYDRDMFLNSAIQALQDLCNHVIGEGDTLYHSFPKETAQHLLVDLGSMKIPKNYSQVFYDEVSIEEFHFKFLEPYSCDTPYEIKIGDRTYKSYLSDWTTDFDCIRHNIETFIYSSSTQVYLNYEDEPTTLSLQYRTLYHNGEGVKVTVKPDSFTKWPMIFGWCEGRQLLRSLYLGLLNLPIVETDWFDDEYSGDWTEFRLKTYNQLQSNIIEDYIKGVKDERASSRNRLICTVEEMFEDFKRLKETL